MEEKKRYAHFSHSKHYIILSAIEIINLNITQLLWCNRNKEMGINLILFPPLFWIV